MKPGDVASFARYVLKRAPQYQLDPNAVVAVALQEGISGKVGDNGTSFGPFMLHVGGAYPAKGAPNPADQQAANAWAWSPAGIDYALSRMQPVAGGLKGRAAVQAIVYRFERPADPAAEYAAAVKALPASDGGASSGGGIGSILRDVPTPIPGVSVGSVAGPAGGVAKGAEAVTSFLGHLTDPHYLLRGLEIAAGGMLVLFGLFMLGRSTGLANRVTEAAGSVAAVIPETRAVAPAIQAKAAQGRQRRQEARAARERRRELDAKYGAEAPF